MVWMKLGEEREEELTSFWQILKCREVWNVAAGCAELESMLPSAIGLYDCEGELSR